MPIKISNELPAYKILTEENIFVMSETRAVTQDIRPLKIAILNLMPTKIDTETQLLRLLGNSPLQVEIELLHTKTHKSKNISTEHLLAFYKTFDDVKKQNYDGMIITGAPVEHLPFEKVNYWDELCAIMEWSKVHVHSTFTFAGERKRGFTIIMVLTNNRWIKNSLAYFLMLWRKNPLVCSEDLTIPFWCRIPDTPQFAGKTLKKFQN